MTAANPTAGFHPFDPVAPLRAQTIPMWPAITLGLVGAGVLIGTIVGNRKGALWGALSGAIVGAVALLNPGRAEMLVARGLDLVRRGGVSTGSTKLGERLAPRIEQYREFLSTFPGRAARRTEETLRKAAGRTHEYEVGVAKEAVSETMKMHLKGRILLEGLGGGISWALFRQRDTVGERLVDFGTGFVGGVMFEFPYHAFNIYFQDVLSALKGSKAAGHDVRAVLAAQGISAMKPDDLVAARESDSIGTVRDRLTQSGHSQLPVLNADDRPIGMVHASDVFGVVADKERLEGRVATLDSSIRGVMQLKIDVVDRATPSHRLVEALRAGRAALLVDDQGRAEGMLDPGMLLTNPLLSGLAA